MGNRPENKKHLGIAMLGHKHIPSREGGVEIVVEELSVRMAALGHSVTCYNRGGNAKRDVRRRRTKQNAAKSKSRQKTYRGVRIKTVPTLDKKGLAALTSSFFASIAAAFGPYDVVHIHAEGPAFMCFLPKLTGKKVIVTVHGLDHRRAKWGRFASAYIMAGERFAVRFADEIIVLSRGVQRYFLETYGRKTVFIPNGVTRPVKREASVITKRWGLLKDGYILFLGRLVPEKGIRYLMEAYRGLDTDKKLVIAGGSSDTDEFAAELKKTAKGDDRIVFTGFVEGRALEELYSNAYVYVLPSDLEGMPLSLLEAMSYGNCCLVSDIDECVEVVEDKAVTFKKADVDDLREKLRMLAGDPGTVEAYKESAADFICGKYDWDRVVRKTLKLYRR